MAGAVDEFVFEILSLDLLGGVNRELAFIDDVTSLTGIPSALHSCETSNKLCTFSLRPSRSTSRRADLAVSCCAAFSKAQMRFLE